MSESILLGLTTVITLGVLAQWIGWRFNLPSILLLLVFGFLAGLAARAYAPHLAPDTLFGDLLLPLVSLFVGIILYEGGLSLNLREIASIRGVVLRLVTVGIVVTWVLTAVAARGLIGLSWNASLLIGAVLVVSGPTVIIPMLRLLRPIGQVGSIIKWEGIVNDPIGALLAVLVFEATTHSNGVQAATSMAVMGVLKTIMVGGGLGVAAAYLLALLLRRHLIPDFLHNAISLMFVTLAFAVSNSVQHEAGLFAVTLMGRGAGESAPGQRQAHHRVQRALARDVDFDALHPAIGAVDGQRSDATRVGEPGVCGRAGADHSAGRRIRGDLGQHTQMAGARAILGWLAPRGIVAAAVASVFALRLGESDPQAAMLGPLAFLVIVATVSIYGLTVGPLARMLGVADPNPQGFLLVGAHRWARALAEVLKRAGVSVVLVDSNRSNVKAARMAELRAHEANALGDFIDEELDLQGIGRMLALTPNDEVNALAAQRFIHPVRKTRGVSGGACQGARAASRGCRTRCMAGCSSTPSRASPHSISAPPPALSFAPPSSLRLSTWMRSESATEPTPCRS